MTLTTVRGVEVFHWNPKRPVIRGRLGRVVPLRRPVGNFGDLLGPEVVDRLAPDSFAPPGSPRLLTVGSILHFAADSDVVWGSGVNGKVPTTDFRANRLDVRAVRGPLTAEFLQARGIEVPEVFGDPGLLAPALLGVGRSETPRIAVTHLPNLHDAPAWRKLPGFLSPTTDPRRVFEAIGQSRLVISSSLHGLVIADALGVPVSLVRPRKESLFKYQDYLEGTGRSLGHVSDDVSEALRHRLEPLQWDSEPLVAAFPRDIWVPQPESARG
jgi:pyruvyltransferase